MPRFVMPGLVFLCVACAMDTQAEQNSTVLIRLPLSDERIIISADERVYYPGDTIRLSIIRGDTVANATVTPILNIEGVTLSLIGNDTYTAIIPLDVIPGSYQLHLDVLDAQHRRIVYSTDCVVVIEEFEDIEQIARYTKIVPEAGGKDMETAVTLDRERIAQLQVIFLRDSIREGMGPQFITIRTTVQLRWGGTAQTFERRVMSFRSHGDPDKDRAMFVQYRRAYGPYAAISTEELERVGVVVDSLPSWAIVRVTVTPDYTIKIGAVDQSNSVTRYFRVRGPKIETGLTLGVPKVLYDTQADDSIEYGNTSAMLRLYFVDGSSGHRFPVNLGVGSFGVNSPVDMSAGRGGFAASIFLDMIELMRRLDIDFGIRVNAGLEMTPFMPISRRSRLLFDVHVGLAL